MANNLEVIKMFKKQVVMAIAGLSLNLMLTSQVLAGETVNQSQPAEDILAVNIENVQGRVVITGQDTDQVTVKGELDEKTEKFVFERSGNQINIKVKLPHNLRHSGNRDGSDLTITMPKNVRMNFVGVSTDVIAKDLHERVGIRTVSGDIDASNLAEHIELESVSGNIDAERMTGKVNLSTVSGNIEDEKSAGRLSVKTVSGDIEIDSSASVVELNAISGDIDFQLAEVGELKVVTVSGNAKGALKLMDGGNVKLSSVSGGIDLAMQENVNADFRLKSNAGGNLINKLTNDKAERAKYGPSSKLYFTTGNGSASVKGSIVSGRIKLTKM